MRAILSATSILGLALSACGDDGPRFGTIVVTEGARDAVLSGVTNPTTAALEIAPGCAGYVDLGAPEHVIDVRVTEKLGLSARSERGPVVLLVEGDDGVVCDSDENTGHVPHVQLTAAGRYRVRVGSLASTEALPYELVVARDSKEAHGAGSTVNASVSVTVTSSPSGAVVKTLGGQVLGTTPAMFVVPGARPGDINPYTFVVEHTGFVPAQIAGVPQNGEIVLNATLTAAGPRVVAVRANTPQQIRDFATVSQALRVEEQCSISDMEVAVEIQHSYVADLVIELRGPAGQTATIHRFAGGARRNLSRTYAMSNNRTLERAFESTEGQGEWTMTVRDNAEADTGTFDAFEVRLTCAPPTQASAPASSRTAAVRGVQSGTASAGLRQPVWPPRRPRAEVLDPWAP
jgi:subtilisin-like proprotein convertase family protein